MVFGVKWYMIMNVMMVNVLKIVKMFVLLSICSMVSEKVVMIVLVVSVEVSIRFDFIDCSWDGKFFVVYI